MDKMFCFQCEQTFQSKGCTIQGVCGKNPEVANIQDELISKIIQLARVCEHSKQNTKTIVESLFMTITNVNFDYNVIKNMISQIEAGGDFNIKSVWENENINIRSLKSLILFGLKGIAAYYHHAMILNYYDDEIDEFFYTALNAISSDLSSDELLKFVLKTGKINLETMELLDKAHRETFGKPVVTKVSTTIEPGPFIVVSGHDLKDLALLLKKSENKGVNIYTHGEMLPAHSYPELKKYPHLKGNFGTAWQNQQKEFSHIPAPVLFTTNCLMRPTDSYIDRVYTTSIVGYPNLYHIGEDKDFTPLINKALELKGYSEIQDMKGINGGNTLTVGFNHNTVLSNIDKIINAIKSSKIKHIFLVGGCDGAKPGRNYYTEFVKLTPKDSLILTLACGKYRFNDLDLGEIEGIPRILDMGQCNDAYSAIKVAFELSKALNCPINELPLSFVLSWYEQKAVSILLTLFYLGIENIRLGPSLPAFVSQDVLNILTDKFKIKPITTPKEDLEDLLS